MRPLDESDRAMWSDNADPNEEWKVWKLIPSTATEQDVENLEKDYWDKTPTMFESFSHSLPSLF